jgi:hypothetical protein
MPRQYYHLTPEDRAHFLEHGWLRVPSSIKKKYIDAWLSDMWVRLGMDENDKSTWSTEYLKLPRHREEKAEEVCPEAWEKMCELVGGEEMVDPVRERHYGDQFIINFGTEELTRSKAKVDYHALPGWHCDNDWSVALFQPSQLRRRVVEVDTHADHLRYRYRCFVDSSNNALTVILCFTDIPASGGGTALAEDSFKSEHLSTVSRVPADAAVWCETLFANPAGFDPPYDKQLYSDIIAKCTKFSQIEAKAGDVFITHSFLLHTQTPNFLNYARVIANPHVNLREPYNLNRSNGDYVSANWSIGHVQGVKLAECSLYQTLCEQIILNALGHPAGIPTSLYNPARPRAVYYPNSSWAKRERIPGELARMLADAKRRGLGPDSVDSVYLKGEEALREHEWRNGYDKAAGPGGLGMGGATINGTGVSYGENHVVDVKKLTSAS